MSDLVNHPPHYGAERFGVECISFTRHMTFDGGNSFKYVWRHLDKGRPRQDLEKALWYLNDVAESGSWVWINDRQRSPAVELFDRTVTPLAPEGSPHRALVLIAHDRLDLARIEILRQIENRPKENH